MFVIAAALLAVMFGLTCRAASGAAEEPVVTGAGVFLRRPGGLPVEIGFDGEGRLDTAAPPGSELFFIIDNAVIASHLSGYSAYIRFAAGEEYVEPSPVIRYVELFDAEGASVGYRYAVCVRFSPGNYQEPPVVTGFVRVGTRSLRQNEFRFTAVLQEGPLDDEIGEVVCLSDTELFTFAHEFGYTRLIFAEGEDEYNKEEYGEFFVRTGRQRPLDLSFTREADPRITAAFPEGDFIALAFKAGPVFDNMGELSIAGPKGYYLYEITKAGLSSPIYSYNDAEGMFVLMTRRMGNYLLSSITLPEDIFGSFKPNPLTGAL